MNPLQSVFSLTFVTIVTRAPHEQCISELKTRQSFNERKAHLSIVNATVWEPRPGSPSLLPPSLTLAWPEHV